MNWTLSVLIICVLLAAFTTWLEIRRANRSRLLLRILVSILGIAALACIALPITYQSKSKISDGSEAVLLTENYNPDSLSHGGYKLIFTTSSEIKKSYPKARLIAGMEDLLTIRPAISKLHILGYGLDTDDLQQLGNIPVVYSSPPAPTGILSISWTQQLKSGALLKVQGTFNNTASKPIKLLLKGLNTQVDSVNIPAEKQSGFELATTPKITGTAVYNLLAINGQDTIERENVPIIIEPVQPVSVLLLSSSPDFESKFLKNWLSQNGYVIAIRTAISKNKISQEFVNMQKQPMEKLSAALLNKFDLVIGESSAFKALTGSENALLKQQVDQNGMGIIIRADDSSKTTSWLQDKFRVTTLNAKSQVSSALLLQNQKLKTTALSIDPSYISSNYNTQNLALDLQNHALASTALSGCGKLVFTTLNNTYNWLLTGNNKDYAALWSLLIDKAARRLPQAQNLSVNSGIAKINEPVNVRLESSSIPSQLTINKATISLVQSHFAPYEWNFSYWPQKFGWQQTIIDKKSTDLWYSYQKNDWMPLINYKKSALTKKHSENSTRSLSVTKQIQSLGRYDVPKMYFYLILIASLVFLWIERKLSV
ncbi:MAG: hypothetical protein JWQ84_1534 [Mucilaginibacter sp.]|nr:hypothetical protein [Mucilaginibacter sp.]